MRVLKLLVIMLSTGLLNACDAQPKMPIQVIYRFDDHRYLELEGKDCEGALWYVDKNRNIRAEIVERDNPIFRISFFKYVHPSEKYIAIPWDDLSGFLISKDYGQTWDGARFAPGTGAIRYGADGPQREEIDSITVVNDQGFVLTKQGDLYLSSKPFDDPRLEPGGSGINYTITNSRGQLQTNHMRPGYGGGKWGKEYVSWNSFAGPGHWTTDAYRTNFQGIPNKIPEVKNYTGWDHMRCDPDLGLTSK